MHHIVRKHNNVTQLTLHTHYLKQNATSKWYPHYKNLCALGQKIFRGGQIPVFFPLRARKWNNCCFVISSLSGLVDFPSTGRAGHCAATMEIVGMIPSACAKTTTWDLFQGGENLERFHTVWFCHVVCLSFLHESVEASCVLYLKKCSHQRSFLSRSITSDSLER